LPLKGRQEDAQEFLSFLLNRLHDEMVKCLESQDPAKQQEHMASPAAQQNGFAHAAANGTQHDANAEDGADEWQEVGRKNRAFITRRVRCCLLSTLTGLNTTKTLNFKAEFKQSPLSDIFCGQFRTTLSQSGLKEKESISLEPFFTIPLDIQSNSINTIQDALEHFVKKEEILDVTHPDTKQHVSHKASTDEIYIRISVYSAFFIQIEAYKRISFEDLPPVLILYLKCFVYDKSGGVQKLSKRIEYQIDLEINKSKDNTNKQRRFGLTYYFSRSRVDCTACEIKRKETGLQIVCRSVFRLSKSYTFRFFSSFYILVLSRISLRREGNWWPLHNRCLPSGHCWLGSV
jgi:ubiquitin carboxyl-terminal hydrolase 10